MGQIDDIIKEISPYYKKKGPDIEYKLIYDTPSGTLEPLYFWILNFMGPDTEKLIDTFASSPGSGHFSELGLKKSQMQEQASKLMQTINAVLRSVLNLIYDLKEFQIRLFHYDAANDKDKLKQEAGILALKQIWMDKVDLQRGQGSINALSSGNLQFVTLRDAFLKVKDEKEVDKIDLNERVKRILKPRILEFNEWRKRSEMELRKRFEIEKTYLKSQVDALKLQSKWAKPYLIAAEKLSQDENLARDSALVTAFNTILLQLTLMKKLTINVEEESLKSRISDRRVPEDFAKIAKKYRAYHPIVFVNFKFTGIPNKVGQQFVFGGKAEMEFKAYALNEEELILLKDKLENSDLESALKLVQGMTDDSLKQLQIDIDELTEKKEEKKGPDSNPFFALFSFKKKEEKDDKKEKIKKLKDKGIKPDRYTEAYIRNVSITDAMNEAFKIYDTFKKSLRMATPPYKTGDPQGRRFPPTSKVEELFGLK
ncbi:MAG: hypothetical protein AABW83_02670 [Nanoarchaeota archaeon]